MTDKEKIKAEIERLRETNKVSEDKEYAQYELDVKCGYYMALNDMLSFINSLPEEPVSEDLEATLAKEWQGYVDRDAATVDALEDNTQELAFAKGFYRGWNYPKSSVWHDANKEQPEHGSAVAVWNPKIMDGEILTTCVEVYQDRIWAYIDDLLKL